MKIDSQNMVVLVIIGVVAALVAFVFFGGLLRLLVTGILGAFVGGYVVNAAGINLGIKNPMAAQVVTALIGAVIVMILARLIV